ncbi:hypothetical protein [Thermocatellispora tengchongensis]|uniref:hypothetical protein n=1 Tax=Thermocatellispora tengchongensis TaxID=1073253 RepID=UPI0036309D6E
MDVAVRGPDGALLAIGEAKWGDVMGLGHLERLERVAALLAARGEAPDRLLLFSGTGFMPALEEAAARSGGACSWWGWSGCTQVRDRSREPRADLCDVGPAGEGRARGL